ncbi:MAG: metallophosphoesterase [archaeon]|jgi:DNA repair exonuclease SbcCD nuclease subunit
MLLGIFSDTHLGFGDGDICDESFERLKEALAFFRKKNVDAVLHAGDLFDEAVPGQEVWRKAFDCFSENRGKETSFVREKFDESESVSMRGIPFFAIHGTHEFRGKDFANALDVLESAGFLVQLHCAKVVLEKNGEKVAIHGMGGVPERNAKAVLQKFAPVLVEGAKNVLLLHQSFTEFLPFGDESVASLSLSDLPNGFDLIVDGHLHWQDEQNSEGRRLLLTGSTVFTQMKKLEAEREKGLFLFDTVSKKIEFVPFPVQRKLFYEKISFKGAKPEEVKSAVEEKVSNILCKDFELKPLIRFRLVGTLAKGFSQSDISFDLKDAEQKTILSISKEFSSERFEKKMESFREEHLKRKSILEIGEDILEKNVEEAKLEGFDSRRMFGLLSEGENEKAEEVLLEVD